MVIVFTIPLKKIPILCTIKMALIREHLLSRAEIYSDYADQTDNPCIVTYTSENMRETF